MFSLSTRKRKLSQTSENPPESKTPQTSPPTRSEKMYLDDGNIVLVAEDIAFRVHRSQLARHSEVFRNMLAVVDQPGNAEVFDGRPVVRLSDTCTDVLELLLALYDRPKFDPENLDPLISVLRLSTKYLIDHIRAAALKALAEAYPDTLVKYENYKGKRLRCGDVIKLAYEIHAEILLPAAYYTLCGYSAEDALECGLPQPVVEAYFVGKETLSHELADFVQDQILSRAIPDNCSQSSGCGGAWDRIELSAYKMLTATCTVPPTPLEQLKRMGRLGGLEDVCLQCRNDLNSAVSDIRMGLWEWFPVFFRLGLWEELRKTK